MGFGALIDILQKTGCRLRNCPKGGSPFFIKSIPCLFCTVNDKTGELYFLFGGGECNGNLEKIAVNADFEAAAHKLSQA